MRGRKPKPIALRILGGNAGHRAINFDAPTASTNKPKRPRILSKEGRKAWKIICEELEAMSILSRAEFGIIGALAQAYGRWIHAEEELAKTQELVTTILGNIIQNPWLGIANRSIDQISRLSAQLGLDPTARTRIKASIGKEKGNLGKFIA